MSTKILYTGPTGTVSTAVPDSIKMAEKLISEGGFVGPGTVPVGSIVAIADTRAWALPASNAINEGWAICDGSAFPAGSHPSLTGNRPNLRDDRFLQGNSVAGASGGNSSITLTTSHLPEHSHSIDGHKHSIKHKHSNSGTWSDWHNHPIVMQNINQAPYAPDKIPVIWNTATGNSNSAEGPYWWFDAGFIYYNWDDRPEVRLETLGDSHSHTVTHNEFVGDSESGGASSTKNTGSGNAFDIRPKYFNVVYLIRVV